MKVWIIGILFGGFFGFTIATLAFLLELTIYEKDSKRTLLHAVQLLIIIVFGWVAWKAEGVQALVGYILGSFYIVRLILLPNKAKIK
jgi:hypothetical protein